MITHAQIFLFSFFFKEPLIGGSIFVSRFDHDKANLPSVIGVVMNTQNDNYQIGTRQDKIELTLKFIRKTKILQNSAYEMYRT